MKCVKFTAKVVANGDNLRLFLTGQLEHEIRGKPVGVTLDCSFRRLVVTP